MSNRDVLSEDKGVRINVVTPSTPTSGLASPVRASFIVHSPHSPHPLASNYSPPASPIRRSSDASSPREKGEQFKEHMDNFASSNRSRAMLDKMPDAVGASVRRLSAPMDDVVKVQIDPSLALNVSQIAFRHAARQSVTAWTNEIIQRLNAKYSFGLDATNYWLVDVKGVPLDKDMLCEGIGLKDSILALAARNKEETAATLRAIEKAASAVRAAKAVKAEKQKEMQARQDQHMALLQDVKKTVKDKEEAEKAASLEAKRAALAAERKAAKEGKDENRGISRMAVTFDALKTSLARQGRHVRMGSKLMFTTMGKNSPAPVLTVDWALVSTKMPTGKDAESNKLREQLFKLFDTANTGKLTLEQTQKGVVDVLMFGGVLPQQVVKLAFAAAAAFNKDGARLSVKLKSLTVTGKKTAVVVDWVRFRMLLVYLRQYLELFVLFDTINVARDGRVTESEFVAAQSLLEQYGFKIFDLARAFAEIKSTKAGEGVKFKDFAHWGLTKNLRLEDHDPRRSEMGMEEKTPEAKEEESKAQALKLSQFKELMDAKARNLKTGRIVARPHRSWGKNTLERALANPISLSMMEGHVPSDTTIFTPLTTEFVPVESSKPADSSSMVDTHEDSSSRNDKGSVTSLNTSSVQQASAAGGGEEEDMLGDDIVKTESNNNSQLPDDVLMDEDDEENIEAEKKLLFQEEPERLNEYAQLELEVVLSSEKKKVKGILLSGPSVHKSKLQVTDEVRYMPNCMFEQEELEREQEEAERAKDDLDSSDDEEALDPLPSFTETDGIPLVPCEVCDESHAAVSRCVQCEENMCLKLATAHQKSKIGREHTLIPVQVTSKEDFCEVCEEAHAMNMKCVECDEVMCQKVAGAHKRSKIGRDHTVVVLELEGVEEEEPLAEEEEEKLEIPEENLPATEAPQPQEQPVSQRHQDLSAFKAMMDAKVRNYRAGNAIAVIPTGGARLRVSARTWGTGAQSPASSASLSPLSPSSSPST